MNDFPPGYFITWTVFGTFLQGGGEKDVLAQQRRSQGWNSGIEIG